MAALSTLILLCVFLFPQAIFTELSAPITITANYAQDFQSLAREVGTVAPFNSTLPGWFSNQDIYRVVNTSGASGGLFLLTSSAEFLGVLATNKYHSVMFGVALQTVISGRTDLTISFFGAQVSFGGQNHSESSLDAYYCTCSDCDSFCLYQREKDWIYLPNISVPSYVTEGNHATPLDVSLGQNFTQSIPWNNGTMYIIFKTKKGSGSMNSFAITNFSVTLNTTTGNILQTKILHLEYVIPPIVTAVATVLVVVAVILIRKCARNYDREGGQDSSIGPNEHQQLLAGQKLDSNLSLSPISPGENIQNSLVKLLNDPKRTDKEGKSEEEDSDEATKPLPAGETTKSKKEYDTSESKANTDDSDDSSEHCPQEKCTENCNQCGGTGKKN